MALIQDNDNTIAFIDTLNCINLDGHNGYFQNEVAKKIMQTDKQIGDLTVNQLINIFDTVNKEIYK